MLSGSGVALYPRTIDEGLKSVATDFCRFNRLGEFLKIAENAKPVEPVPKICLTDFLITCHQIAQ